MILLLGATGYVGQAFARALRSRKDSFIPLSRSAFDYTRFEFLFDYIRKVGPELVINADEVNDGMMEQWDDGAVRKNGMLEEWNNGMMGEEGKDNGVTESWGNGGMGANGLKAQQIEMLRINAILPQTVARACRMINTPWAQVSSGGIYSGAKVLNESGEMQVERVLGDLAVRTRFELHPESFLGFSELDEPNFSFKSEPCAFYAGTKALGEEAIRNGPAYTWRLGPPFNEHDGPGNFLSQLQAVSRIHFGVNSLSQIDDCVRSCLELWERRAPFGIYHVANPGAVCTQEVVQMIQRLLKPQRELAVLSYEPEPEGGEQTAGHSHCILDVSKLLGTGIKLPSVREALEQSLEKWQPRTQSALRVEA